MKIQTENKDFLFKTVSELEFLGVILRDKREEETVLNREMAKKEEAQ